MALLAFYDKSGTALHLAPGTYIVSPQESGIMYVGDKPTEMVLLNVSAGDFWVISGPCYFDTDGPDIQRWPMNLRLVQGAAEGLRSSPAPGVKPGRVYES